MDIPRYEARTPNRFVSPGISHPAWDCSSRCERASSPKPRLFPSSGAEGSSGLAFPRAFTKGLNFTESARALSKWKREETGRRNLPGMMPELPSSPGKVAGENWNRDEGAALCVSRSDSPVRKRCCACRESTPPNMASIAKTQPEFQTTAQLETFACRTKEIAPRRSTLRRPIASISVEGAAAVTAGIGALTESVECLSVAGNCGGLDRSPDTLTCFANFFAG